MPRAGPWQATIEIAAEGTVRKRQASVADIGMKIHGYVTGVPT